MTAYSNQIKGYIERYKADVGGDGLIDPHVVAEWAFKRGLHKPNVLTVIEAIASDIAQVFREEYRTDRKGRRYRAMHATRQKTGAKTGWLWADLDDPTAPHLHFQKSFAQRRQQIVADCVQLSTDVEVYNDKRNPTDPIQIPFDFTLDIIELTQTPRARAA